MQSQTIQADQIERVVLRDESMSVALLNYGAITQGWWIGDTPLILGYDRPQDYLSDPYYVGAIVGRVANRIGGAQFELDGNRVSLAANEGSTALHGGSAGLAHQIWTLTQIDARKAVLTYTSPDGESGFPGEVKIEIRVTLKYPRLTYAISATPDRPTPISIAQHNYYSLGHDQGIADHSLKLASNRFLAIDEKMIPTGVIESVSEGFADFTSPQRLGSFLDSMDHFFLFETDRNPQHPVAEVETPSGLSMAVYSDQPGAQVYTAGTLSDPFFKGAGLCFEPSGYPDAVNNPAFPSMLYSPDRPYRQTLTLEISGTSA